MMMLNYGSVYSERKSRNSGEDGSLVMEHLTPPDSRNFNSSFSILIFQAPSYPLLCLRRMPNSTVSHND
jgi:hypothetical protein